MITREEYNKALDIVEAYNKQLFTGVVSSSLRSVGKTPLLEWEKFNLLKGRLPGVLKEIYDYNLDKKNKITYLEDLVWLEFRTHRGAGKKTWDEFVKMRGY